MANLRTATEVPDLATATDAELEALRAAVVAEIRRRSIIASAQQQAEQQAQVYAEAVKDEAPLTAVPAGGVGPGRKITEGGKTYRNTSGAWLPVGPSAYPQGYQLASPPEASSVTAWKAGEAVKVGDLRSHQSKTYKALQAHTTQAGWEPPNVPALWALA